MLSGFFGKWSSVMTYVICVLLGLAIFAVIADGIGDVRSKGAPRTACMGGPYEVLAGPLDIKGGQPDTTYLILDVKWPKFVALPTSSIRTKIFPVKPEDKAKTYLKVYQGQEAKQRQPFKYEFYIAIR